MAGLDDLIAKVRDLAGLLDAVDGRTVGVTQRSGPSAAPTVNTAATSSADVSEIRRAIRTEKLLRGER